MDTFIKTLYLIVNGFVNILNRNKVCLCLHINHTIHQRFSINYTTFQIAIVKSHVKDQNCFLKKEAKKAFNIRIKPSI